MLMPVKKRFDLPVTTANQSFVKEFELDKVITNIKGLLVTGDKEDLVYYRGTSRIEINKWEYFPDNYQCKLLMSGLSVSPNERYYDMKNANPGNGIIKFTFTDTDDGRTPFTPYVVSLDIDCEMNDGL